MPIPKFELLTLIASLCIGGCAAADDGENGVPVNLGGSMHSSGAASVAGGAPGAGAPSVAGAPAGGSPQVGSGGSVAGSPGLGGGGSSYGGSSSAGRGGSGGFGGTGGKSGGSGGASAGAAGAPPLGKFIGNITTGNSVDTGGMKFAKYWDQITPENSGKWGSVQSSATGAFNWSALDAVYAYTETNRIVFKQHAFVWGSQQPSGTPTLAQVENWIKSFCQRYPNTRLIDVVNEPPPHTTPRYTANLGAGETGQWGWITKAFKLARQHCPGAVLILNDYNNIEYGDQESHFIDIVKQIKAAGAPIDAVGAQAHALRTMSASQLQKNLDTMASQTGLPIYITEYDIGEANDATQLATYKAQIPIFRNMKAVHGITIWGWINGRTWVANTGLVNGTTPRSAMTWLMGELGRPVPPN
ncbi:MAG TPA: endo-1,4-beta-xylanase [Polyangiaceae bacterium]|nr:endo-1,4-beta-xylanase [Polyangiaceae bacterium]